MPPCRTPECRSTGRSGRRTCRCRSRGTPRRAAFHSGRLKSSFVLAHAEAFDRSRLASGQLFQDLARRLLLRRDGFLASVLQHRQLRGQRLALFGVRAPDRASSLRDPAGRVARRVCRVDAERAAEAGLLRARAGQRDDGAVFAPGLIVGVDRLGQKHLVQDLKAARVARADAEQRRTARSRRASRSARSASH